MAQAQDIFPPEIPNNVLQAAKAELEKPASGLERLAAAGCVFLKWAINVSL